jgi:hypothetical protein
MRRKQMADKEKKTYEQMLEENAKTAATIIGEYLRGERPGHDDVTVSSVSISQFNRFLATKGAYKSLAFQIARSLTEDKEELQKLMQQENRLLTG